MLIISKLLDSVCVCTHICINACVLITKMNFNYITSCRQNMKMVSSTVLLQLANLHEIIDLLVIQEICQFYHKSKFIFRLVQLKLTTGLIIIVENLNFKFLVEFSDYASFESSVVLSIVIQANNGLSFVEMLIYYEWSQFHDNKFMMILYFLMGKVSLFSLQ